jgi:acetylornithine deacetylase/succinyl-diaminopimelate desuccinylase-like protein
VSGASLFDDVALWLRYLEAIRVLQERRFTPRRTVHVLFVPDEEIGGHDGMEKFIKTPEFRALNIGFLLDEGLRILVIRRVFIRRFG